MKQEQIPMYIRKMILLTILLVIIQALGGCSSQASYPRPKAENGVISLTQTQFDNDVVQLDGEWEFYWQQLLEPDEIDSDRLTGYISIPSSWNNYKVNEGTISGDGYATYRLIFLTEEKEKLALKIPRVRTAYKLWVNGELSASAGTVGTTRDTMIPQYIPQVAFLESQPGENEIVIQVSNFYHRSGGLLESIKLGSEKQILKIRDKNVANNILLFGCLAVMGAYHLALFYFRRKNTPALYFGAFCILIGIRTLLVGECFLLYLFPGFSWEIAHRIMTLTYYLGVPLIMMFFLSVFPAYFNIRIIKMAQIIGVVFAILVLLTPARIFTLVNPLYQIWTIIVIIYIFIALTKIAIRKEKDSWLIILGAVAFLLTTLNDVIFLSIWMNDNGPAYLKTVFRKGNLSSVGQLIFAFANSLLLAKKYSESLEQEEIANLKLIEVNTNLDKIVSHRTEALIKSNEKIEQQKLELEKINHQLKKLSLKDPLTKLGNRRQYDRIIISEWNQCLRHQRPIALILLDIDFFKKYNDYYGHLAGDECLTKIGQTIKDSLSSLTDKVVRYGGEEFIAILPDTEKEDAIKIAEILRQHIEALHIPHLQSTVSNYVTVSIGVTSAIPDTNSSHEKLFEVADKALYQAKAGGRNQVVFLYDE